MQLQFMLKTKGCFHFWTPSLMNSVDPRRKMHWIHLCDVVEQIFQSKSCSLLGLLVGMLTETPAAATFLPCWLLSSILWDSTWKASDPAPCRCARCLWSRAAQELTLSVHLRVGVCSRECPDCLSDITSSNLFCTRLGRPCSFLWLALTGRPALVFIVTSAEFRKAQPCPNSTEPTSG